MNIALWESWPHWDIPYQPKVLEMLRCARIYIMPVSKEVRGKGVSSHDVLSNCPDIMRSINHWKLAFNEEIVTILAAEEFGEVFLCSNDDRSLGLVP